MLRPNVELVLYSTSVLLMTAIIDMCRSQKQRHCFTVCLRVRVESHPSEYHLCVVHVVKCLP